jgi:hypothetical protein
VVVVTGQIRVMVRQDREMMAVHMLLLLVVVVRARQVTRMVSGTAVTVQQATGLRPQPRFMLVVVVRATTTWRP